MTVDCYDFSECTAYIHYTSSKLYNNEWVGGGVKGGLISMMRGVEFNQLSIMPFRTNGSLSVGTLSRLLIDILVSFVDSLVLSYAECVPSYLLCTVLALRIRSVRCFIPRDGCEPIDH